MTTMIPTWYQTFFGGDARDDAWDVTDILKDNSRLGIVGDRGSGKTALALDLARKSRPGRVSSFHTANTPNTIIVDSTETVIVDDFGASNPFNPHMVGVVRTCIVCTQSVHRLAISKEMSETFEHVLTRSANRSLWRFLRGNGTVALTYEVYAAAVEQLGPREWLVVDLTMLRTKPADPSTVDPLTCLHTYSSPEM